MRLSERVATWHHETESAMTDFTKYKVSYKKGDRIFATGDPGETMYIVHSGRIRIFKPVQSQEIELAVFEKGDFFGEMAMFEHLPRSASAEAIEDTELLSIDPSTFADMIRANPEIAIRMMRKYSIRLREATRRLEEVTSSTSTLAGTEDLATPHQVRAPTPHEMPPNIKALLIVEGSGRTFPITCMDTLIGRLDHVTGLKPEIDLSGEDVSRHISRRHARITFRDGKFFLSEEVGAMNGTFLNGEKVTQQGVLYPLQEADRVTFCQINLIFHAGI